MTEPLDRPAQGSAPRPDPAAANGGRTPSVEPALRIESMPNLRGPILVCAFAGWNDAAQSATGAVRYLIERCSARRFAGIEPEEFYVFTETRPTISLVEGSQRRLDWPANDFHYVRRSEPSADLVFMAGVEPQLGWRTFTGAIIDLARRLGARMVVTFGGLLADVPHSAPVRLTGQATDPELLPGWRHLTVRSSRYEGPTGIVGVLADACRQAGVPSASIWANVPHYINVSPNPKTLATLVHQANALFDLDLDLDDLDEASRRFERQVSEAVDENPDVREYVRRLEAAADDEAPDPAADLPSGAAIIEELEEFLRRRNQEDDEDDD